MGNFISQSTIDRRDVNVPYFYSSTSQTLKSCDDNCKIPDKNVITT